MQKVTKEWLQSIEALRDVPQDQLQWWIDNSRHYELEEGDLLLKQGTPTTGTHVIITGRIQLYIAQKAGIQYLSLLGSGDVSGYLPFSRAIVNILDGRALENTQLMTFPVERMNDLIHTQFELTQALVHIMSTRVRDSTILQQQNEKMMALGKLSAGLAHELNNPAAAIVRGSASLSKHLKLKSAKFKEISTMRMSEQTIEQVNAKMLEVLAREQKQVFTMMQRADLESDFMDCLDSHGVANSQEISESFVEYGFTCDDMEELSAIIPVQYLSPVLNWISDSLVIERMVRDIQDASQRIEKLVGAIKNFTHMDRGRHKEYADIHSGIQNTLTMLAYKLNKGNVELLEDYDTSLPRIKVFVGEMNQVWTNIIDNALDAMEFNKRGRLEIKTKRDGNFIEVTISDDGHGIPEELKSRIFEPFFTTREIGKGTGLGLDVVSRITRQHGGSLQVDSVPGRTAFVLCFPIND
ncbi:sensor histidine kinase [Arcticibacter sp.]|jgi:signal transduction histidine kinase|uniref:sensor histidine kinase n=1 Tax=Arcticibacter sp. TaxID=1872630 RepID=UPI00388F49C4